MFGRRFDLEKAGAPRAPFFSARLFGKAVTGACDWSRAHTQTDMPGADRFKFSLEPHPLETEGRKRRLEPTAEWKAREVAKRREALLAADDATIKRVLKETMAKEKVEAIGDHVEQDFIHDFHNWVAGIGKRSDYVKAGVPLASVGQGKLVSDHPSVLNYVEGVTSRVIDYYAEIANMKMRGPAIGRRGGPATLDDLWLYFKYVVRNEPVDPRDFAPQPGADEPDERLVGNQNGIVDRQKEAPSMKRPATYGREDRTEEAALRRAVADEQVRANETPKAIAKKAKRDAEMDAGAPEPPKKVDGGAPSEGGARRHEEEPKRRELRPRKRDAEPDRGGKKAREAAAPPRAPSPPPPAAAAPSPPPPPAAAPPRRPEPDFSLAAELARKHAAPPPPPPPTTRAVTPPPPPPPRAVTPPPRPPVDDHPRRLPVNEEPPKVVPTAVPADDHPRPAIVPSKEPAKVAPAAVPADDHPRTVVPSKEPAKVAPSKVSTLDANKALATLTEEEKEALRREMGHRSLPVLANADPVRMMKRVEQVKAARVKVGETPAAPILPEAAAAPPPREPTKVPPAPIAVPADDHAEARELARAMARLGKPAWAISDPITAKLFGEELVHNGRYELPPKSTEWFANDAAYNAAVKGHDEYRARMGLPARSVVGPLLASAAGWLKNLAPPENADGRSAERVMARQEEMRKIAGTATGGSGGFSLPSLSLPSLPSLPALPSISLPGLPSVSLPSIPMDKVKALLAAITPDEAPEDWEKAYEFRVPLAPPAAPAPAPAPAAPAPAPAAPAPRRPKQPVEEWDAQWLRNIQQAERARRLAAMQAAEERRRAAAAPEPVPRELRPEAPLPARAPAGPEREMGRVPYDLRPGLDARLRPVERLTSFADEATTREAEQIAFEDVPDLSRMARFLERMVPRVHETLRAEYAGITAEQVAQAVRLATYSLRLAPHARESFPERIVKAIEASVL
jgi:hypothetical protein